MSGPADVSNAAEIGLQEAVEFIWREADLLDARDYPRWLSLWTENGRYVIPIGREAGDPAAALNIAYDDAAMHEARVKRLNSGLSMSASAAARTVRQVSRFVRTEAPRGGIELRCAQQLVEFKRDQVRMTAADVTYRLLRRDQGLALDEKVVRRINSDETLHGVGYLL